MSSLRARSPRLWLACGERVEDSPSWSNEGKVVGLQSLVGHEFECPLIGQLGIRS